MTNFLALSECSGSPPPAPSPPAAWANIMYSEGFKKEFKLHKTMPGCPSGNKDNLKCKQRWQTTAGYWVAMTESVFGCYHTLCLLLLLGDV